MSEKEPLLDANFKNPRLVGYTVFVGPAYGKDATVVGVRADRLSALEAVAEAARLLDALAVPGIGSDAGLEIRGSLRRALARLRETEK